MQARNHPRTCSANAAQAQSVRCVSNCTTTLAATLTTTHLPPTAACSLERVGAPGRGGEESKTYIYVYPGNVTSITGVRTQRQACDFFFHETHRGEKKGKTRKSILMPPWSMASRVKGSRLEAKPDQTRHGDDIYTRLSTETTIALSL
jgi:hypothetical protein